MPPLTGIKMVKPLFYQNSYLQRSHVEICSAKTKSFIFPPKILPVPKTLSGNPPIISKAFKN